MALFISYSSQDRIDGRRPDDRPAARAKQVWFDQELGGGDSWWAKILEQIRDCDVFVVALSSNWLQSKPSQAELRYAQALNRPILPVRIGDVDSMRVNPLAALQIIDYREPTVDAGIQLVTAVHALRASPCRCPTRCPKSRRCRSVTSRGWATRSPKKSSARSSSFSFWSNCRSGFDEDGDDPSARGDIAQLLRMLRLRHDVTYRTRSEIDNVLAEIEAKDGPHRQQRRQGRSRRRRPLSDHRPTARSGSTAAQRPRPRSVAVRPASGGSNKRLIIIGGAALAVIAAIAVVVLLTTQGSGPKKTPASARTATPARRTGHGAEQPAPRPRGAWTRFCLARRRVGTIVGDPNMVARQRD